MDTVMVWRGVAREQLRSKTLMDDIDGILVVASLNVDGG